jgi:hypothetical protein
MTLQLLHSEFPYIRGNFDFLFYQCEVIVNSGVGTIFFLWIRPLSMAAGMWEWDTPHTVHS